MSARQVIEEVLEIRCEGYDRNTSDAILSALDAAGFYVIHRDELMEFLKAMEAAKETT